MPSSKSATLLGAGAILLWATLASLTAATGAIPPFETTAIVFAIGGALVAATALLRGRAALLRPTPASFALGLYGFFGYHALYFAALKLAPPAEASLITSLWALLTVLFSSLLPGHRLRAGHIVGALLGLAAATMLIWDKLGAGGDVGKPPARLCAGVRLRVRVVELFGRLPPAGRRAERKHRRAVPGHIRARVRLQPRRSSAG